MPCGKPPKITLQQSTVQRTCHASASRRRPGSSVPGYVVLCGTSEQSDLDYNRRLSSFVFTDICVNCNMISRHTNDLVPALWILDLCECTDPSDLPFWEPIVHIIGGCRTGTSSQTVINGYPCVVVSLAAIRFIQWARPSHCAEHLMVLEVSSSWELIARTCC